MLTSSSSSPGRSVRWSRVRTWLERGQAVLLALGAVYLLAIGQLSPHPLPGLSWLAFAVLFAGLTSAFRSSRLRRLATLLCFISVGCGSLALVDIVRKSASTTHAKHGAP